MKSNWINNVHVEGYIFNHSLQHRVSGENSKNPGTPFINGRMQIATDDQGLNVVEVNFTYVTEKYTKSGKDNATYAVLNQIIESGKTFEEVGTAATKVRVDGSVEVNDFPGRDGNMVAAKRIGGSFVHFMNGPITQAPNFETDMLIAGTSMHEVENGDDYLDIRGYAFNFRGDLVPVNYSVINEGGIKYFEDCDISNANPLLTKVWGEIVATTINHEEKIESAFGEPTVRTTSRTIRAWNVIGCSAEPMEFDDESTITKDELKQKLADREAAVAAEKKRVEEYQASRNQGASGFGTAPAKNDSPTSAMDFKF